MNTTGILGLKRREVLLLLCAALAALAVFTYHGVGGCGFVNFDDTTLISGNPHIRDGLTWKSLSWAFSGSLEYVPHWHPLTWLAIMAEYSLAGPEPAVFHLVNMVLHLANVWLFFLLLTGATKRIWPSLLAAALFAVHPLHVESVAWASELKDVLSTLFWLLAAHAYLRQVRAKSEAKSSTGWSLLVMGCMLLGLMAKPMLVMLPVSLLVLDYWPLGRFAQDGKTPLAALLSLIKEKLLLFAVSLAGAVLTIHTASLGRAMVSTDALSLLGRIQNAVISYALYLKSYVFPSGLAVYYPLPPGSRTGAFLLSCAVLLALSLAAWMPRKRFPFLIAGWAWFLLVFLPVIGLLQTGTQAMADRFIYVPSLGLHFAVAWSVARLAGDKRGRTALAAVGSVAVVAMLCFASLRQVPHWRDSQSLFDHALEVTSGNHQIHNALGIVLLGTGDVAQASRHFTKALEAKPDSAAAFRGLGLAALKQGDADRAVELFQRALASDPEYPEALSDLGNAYLIQGKWAEAKQQFQAALAASPGDIAARFGLGLALVQESKAKEAEAQFLAVLEEEPRHAQALYRLGILGLGTGNPPGACLALYHSLALDPGSAQTHATLGGALLTFPVLNKALLPFSRWSAPNLSVGHNALETVLFHLVRAVTLNPALPGPYNNIGATLFNAGQPKTAAAYFQKALAANPDYLDAHVNMGLTMLTLEEPVQAAKHLARALELDPDNPRVLQALELIKSMSPFDPGH